jgi:zinc protease
LERAKSSLERELHKVSSIRVDSEELERSRAFLLGSHEISLQRTSSQAMTMALMELYGLGWDDFQTYTHRMKRVTSEDVSKAAAEYFEKSGLNLVTVSV